MTARVPAGPREAMAGEERPGPSSWPSTLREYAFLGDGQRGALVDPRGNLAWLCFPGYADPAVFASLLGSGGTYRVSPLARAVPGGFYEDGTLIWHSRWMTEHGVVESRDALAFPAERDRMILLRRLVTVDEPGVLGVELALGDDYGRRGAGEWARRGEHWVMAGGARFQARWSGASGARPGAGAAFALEVELNPGERTDLVLELSTGELGEPPDPDALWAQTERAWARAVPRADGVMAARDVRRSCAVLRGMTDPGGGGTVAAATTSLPERAGAGRNYDYRYCWVRDVCYIGHAGAALAGGESLLDDAVRFVAARLLADGPETKPAYTADGGPVPAEAPLDSPGFPGGHNVVGNRAGSQFQLDLFGEALLLFADAAAHGRLEGDARAAVDVAIDAVEVTWGRPDAGIWEIQDRLWAHSRLICAAGLRAVTPWLEAPVARRVGALADHLVETTARTCVHPSGRWQRAPDDDRVDASLLLAELRGALPGDDPRSVATREAVVRELSEDGYIYRMAHAGGSLSDAEGAFLICNLWMSLVSVRARRPVDGLWWFERARAATSASGLFSEEYDVVQHQLRGNLPQAFVHALLIETAAAHGSFPSLEPATDTTP